MGHPDETVTNPYSGDQQSTPGTETGDQYAPIDNLPDAPPPVEVTRYVNVPSPAPHEADYEAHTDRHNIDVYARWIYGINKESIRGHATHWRHLSQLLQDATEQLQRRRDALAQAWGGDAAAVFLREVDGAKTSTSEWSGGATNNAALLDGLAEDVDFSQEHMGIFYRHYSDMLTAWRGRSEDQMLIRDPAAPGWTAQEPVLAGGDTAITNPLIGAISDPIGTITGNREVTPGPGELLVSGSKEAGERLIQQRYQEHAANIVKLMANSYVDRHYYVDQPRRYQGPTVLAADEGVVGPGPVGGNYQGTPPSPGAVYPPSFPPPGFGGFQPAPPGGGGGGELQLLPPVGPQPPLPPPPPGGVLPPPGAPPPPFAPPVIPPPVGAPPPPGAPLPPPVRPPGLPTPPRGPVNLGGIRPPAVPPPARPPVQLGGVRPPGAMPPGIRPAPVPPGGIRPPGGALRPPLPGGGLRPPGAVPPGIRPAPVTPGGMRPAPVPPGARPPGAVRPGPVPAGGAPPAGTRPAPLPPGARPPAGAPPGARPGPAPLGTTRPGGPVPLGTIRPGVGTPPAAPRPGVTAPGGVPRPVQGSPALPGATSGSQLGGAAGGRAAPQPGAPSRLTGAGQPVVQRGGPTLPGATAGRTGQPGGPRGTSPATGRPSSRLDDQGRQRPPADADETAADPADPWSTPRPAGLIESSEPERPAQQGKPIEPTG
jgi:uncharacterized protein YukE